MLMDSSEPEKFDGDDFFDTIEPMTKNLFRMRKRLIGRGLREYEKEASPLYYFKAREEEFA